MGEQRPTLSQGRQQLGTQDRKKPDPARFQAAQRPPQPPQGTEGPRPEFNSTTRTARIHSAVPHSNVSAQEGLHRSVSQSAPHEKEMAPVVKPVGGTWDPQHVTPLGGPRLARHGPGSEGAASKEPLSCVQPRSAS